MARTQWPRHRTDNTHTHTHTHTHTRSPRHRARTHTHSCTHTHTHTHTHAHTNTLPHRHSVFFMYTGLPAMILRSSLSAQRYFSCTYIHGCKRAIKTDQNGMSPDLICACQGLGLALAADFPLNLMSFLMSGPSLNISHRRC